MKNNLFIFNIKMLKILKTLIYSYLVILASCIANKVCRDPSGKEVDWYSIFLMPKSLSSDGSLN